MPQAWFSTNISRANVVYAQRYNSIIRIVYKVVKTLHCVIIQKNQRNFQSSILRVKINKK